MPKWVVGVGAAALLVVLVVAAVWATRAESEPASAESPAAPAPGVSTVPSSPSPTPTPTPEVVIWAGEVCEARDGFIASLLQVASSLEYDPARPESVGEQFQGQIESQLVTLEDEARAVGAALGGIPVDYIEAAAAVSMLQGRIDAVTQAKDEALSHVTAAQEAGDPVSAGLEWLSAAAAAKATYDAGIAAKDSFGTLVDSTDGDVRDAFATAPRCGEFSLG